MYFDFEDLRPDIAPIGRAISAREGILLSFVAHLALLAVLILSPRLLPGQIVARAGQAAAADRQPPDRTTFVFVQPRVDRPAPRPPERGELSDQDRMARAPERAPDPRNALPFSRGNTPERVDQPPSPPAVDPGSAAGAAAGREGERQPPAAAESPIKAPEAQSALLMPPIGPSSSTGGGRGRGANGASSLAESLRNLQRYVQTFENPQGGGGEFGPEIQFDTKGVEFGPWVRRFVAQVKRNWYVPYAAMSLKGHVVITFNVHKNGAITNLDVVGPCPIEAFNQAAFGALVASNPTQPLPPEYPADKAFFTVTFFYNEPPP